jgi:hypothetical protein
LSYGLGTEGIDRSALIQALNTDETNWIYLCCTTSPALGISLKRINNIIDVEATASGFNESNEIQRNAKNGQTERFIYVHILRPLHNTISESRVQIKKIVFDTKYGTPEDGFREWSEVIDWNSVFGMKNEAEVGAKFKAMISDL